MYIYHKNFIIGTLRSEQQLNGAVPDQSNKNRIYKVNTLSTGTSVDLYSETNLPFMKGTFFSRKNFFLYERKIIFKFERYFGKILYKHDMTN